jgi:hypothetical protein
MMRWPLVIGWLVTVLLLYAISKNTTLLAHRWWERLIVTVFLTLPCLAAAYNNFGDTLFALAVIAAICIPYSPSIIPIITVWMDHNWLLVVWVYVPCAYMLWCLDKRTIFLRMAIRGEMPELPRKEWK